MEIQYSRNLQHANVKFLIDFSWLFSRSKYAFRELSFESGGTTYLTGPIYGVHEAIMLAAREFTNVEILLCMDGDPTKQLKASAGYKDSREKDSAIGVVELSRWDVARPFTILPKVNILYHPFMEADETLSFAARTKKPDEVVIIYSGDGDMRQEINSANGVYCCNTYERANGYLLEDEEFLFNHGIKDLTGLTPDAVALFLAITGDSSDGIIGISRFRRAVAKAIANECKTYESLVSYVHQEHKGVEAVVAKGIEMLKENLKQVEVNWGLTNIDPVYIPKKYNQFADNDLAWFDKMGCTKVYSDLQALLPNRDKKEVEV